VITHLPDVGERIVFAPDQVSLEAHRSAVILRTVRNIAGLVSSAYTLGIRWGIVEANPVRASEPPVPRKKEGVVLTIEQQEKLIASAEAAWGECVPAPALARTPNLAMRWPGPPVRAAVQGACPGRV
jgi:hypothetical protein